MAESSVDRGVESDAEAEGRYWSAAMAALSTASPDIRRSAAE